MKRVVYTAAAALAVNRLARRLFRSRLLVLCYHGVCGDRPDVPDPEGMHVPAPIFEAQLRFLVRRYQPVSLGDVRRHCLEAAPLPPGAVLITFYDGYRNVAPWGAAAAAPRYPVRAVPRCRRIHAGRWLWTAELEWRRAQDPELDAVKLWLKGAPSAQRRRALEAEFAREIALPECDSSLLGWSDLRALVEADGALEIGSHGLHHEPLTTCGPKELRVEMAESRHRLADGMGVEVDALAYPNGAASHAVASAARDRGYRLGFTTLGSHVRVRDDPLLLPRILVGARDRPLVLAAALPDGRVDLSELIQALLGARFHARSAG